MRDSDGRMNAPTRSRIAIDGHCRSPTLLVEICRRANNLQLHRSRPGRVEEMCFKLRDREIAIVLPSWSLHRQRRMRKHIEPQGRDLR